MALVGRTEPQRTELGYRPALDGIRALAIVPVVLNHIFGWPPLGALGVDIFFVLSGFLITSLLLTEWGRRGSISLKKFYMRRALRLFPALFALLLAFAVLTIFRYLALGLSQAEARIDLMSAAYGASYVGNWILAFRPELMGDLYHLWSLATEEQFYLIWPAVLLLVMRIGVRRRFVVTGLILIIIAIWVNRALLYLDDATLERLAFAPDTRSDAILLGCLVGIWFSSGKMTDHRVTSTLKWLLPVAVAFAATMILLSPSWSFVYLGGLAAFALAVGVLIASVAVHEESWIARKLSHAVPVFIGKLSYSLYLWHVVVLIAVNVAALTLLDAASALEPVRFATKLVALILSVLAALGSRYLVELPFLKRKKKFEIVHSDKQLDEVEISADGTVTGPAPARRKPRRP